jgi:carboxypeptidase family protein/TonB-dependent receptor-like protein
MFRGGLAMLLRRNVGLFVVAALALFAAPALAQITTGTVTGAVKDHQGAVVPGAAVVLVSATQGTSAQTHTNIDGDFAFPNVAAGRYILRVSMDGFKTLERPDVNVSPGERVIISNLTIEVGTLAETLTVRAETPLVQAQSGERSFVVTTDEVENLPIFNRSFTELAALAPGVTTDGNNTPQRIGGGGDPNIMMDGVSTMDTGSNRPLLQMNIESIAEVKVLTSGYQAEFGRSSGVQVTAVTKSGTNRFRGSFYDVERNSDWNKNSKTNLLNGDPKTVLKERDWGYSIGGPIGRQGGRNKVFFFYAQEFAPRTAGNNVIRYRMPTELERAGDFSQSTDNNGNPYPYIRNPSSTSACSSTNTAGCFADGGVLGRIPANMLYQPGLNILKMYPLPNIANVPAGQAYNYEITRPSESVLSWQPALRVDYQITRDLRANAKYSAWMQRDQTFLGTIPGFNDTKMQKAPVTNFTSSVNWTISPTMFLEATYGRSQNELAGCAQAQSGTGAIFCNNNAGSQGVPMTNISNLSSVGLGGLPFLFPDATILNPGYYAMKALNGLNPPFWDGTRMSKVPPFSWGGRINSNFPPPNIGFPGWFNINRTQDFAISLTKLAGRHTFKTGFYNTHSYKAEQVGNLAFGSINFQHDAVGTNPFDTSFGFSNAAIGTFSSFQQAQKYVETSAVYNNTEGYVQDNWRVNRRLTLDYGMRFVHQGAQYDQLRQASNLIVDQWKLSSAPMLYVAGCANGVYPCSGTNRQAMNPITGQFLGPNSTLAIGTLVPNTGTRLNGLFLPGEGGLPKHATFNTPVFAFGPRFGMAYDLTGTQKLIARGGLGLFYDRPSSTTFSRGVNNPPTSRTITVQYGQLQSLGSGGLTTEGAPAIEAIQMDAKIPTSVQWNSGVQMALPWAVALDVSYVGQHSYNTFNGVNINAVDMGGAFLPKNQDTSVTAGAIPGSTVVSQNQMRAMRGLGAVTVQLNRAWRTYHSIQLSFRRRFRDGVSFGFNDTISLSDRQQAGARIQHNADGTWAYRADQEQADDLLGVNYPSRHIMRANFVWDMPDLKSKQRALWTIGQLINDWQLSGIWQGSTGSGYTVGWSYQGGIGNQQLTGSPDYGARIRVTGDPGSGCSSDPYQQFNIGAFTGPDFNSVGLESGGGYLRGCFQSILDLSIARNIRLPHGRNIQLRVDMFNAPNSAIVTGRATQINYNSPTDQTVRNSPIENGVLVDSRSRPRGAGVGVANAYQSPRRVQAQIRFSF